MTIAQWATYFDIIQDKYGSPYFTDAEKSLLFNRATVQYVQQFFDVRQPAELNIEFDRDSIASLSTLIYELPSITMSSTGIITKAQIQTALTGVLGGALLWREIEIKATLGTSVNPVNYTRHNDWAQFLNNAFKTPTNDNPKCYETALDFRFLPVNQTTQIVFTVVKYPITVDITGAVSSDMPDYTHDKILAIALELAGIASRDEALIALKGTRSQEI